MASVYFEKKTGENILLNDSAIAESGDGYIRFSNGIQICWESNIDVNIASGSTSRICNISYKKFFTGFPITIAFDSAKEYESINSSLLIGNLFPSQRICVTATSYDNFRIVVTPD